MKIKSILFLIGSTFFFFLACNAIKQEAPEDALTTTLIDKELQDKTVQLSQGPAVIYRSQDQGQSWSVFDNGLPTNATVSGFAVDEDQVWASTDGFWDFSTYALWLPGRCSHAGVSAY